MTFEEFRDNHFNGDVDAAIECLAKEITEMTFFQTKSLVEWKNIHRSMNELEKKQFVECRKCMKMKITAKILLVKRSEYRAQRLAFSIAVAVAVLCWFGLMKASGMYNSIIFILTSLCAVGVLAFWIFKNNRNFRAIEKGDFYIKKAECGYRCKKTETVDWSDVDSYSIVFEGYDEYKMKKSEYDYITYGKEYFLVVINNQNKIYNVYSADAWDVSDEFCEVDGKYILKKISDR